MEELYVKIKNEMYLDESFTNEEIVTLALLYRNYNGARGVTQTTIDILISCIYGKSSNYKLINSFKEALIGLYNKGIILDVYDAHYNTIDIYSIKKDTVLTVKLEQVDNEYFEVRDIDIDKIASYCATTNIDKFALLRYTIAISRVINNSCGFGYLTQAQCKDVIGTNKSIKKYNEVLYDLHIFRYTSDYITPIKEYVSTFFGRYDDKANFDNQLNYIVSERGLVKIDKAKANDKRKAYAKKSKEQQIKDLENRLNKLKFNSE